MKAILVVLAITGAALVAATHASARVACAPDSGTGTRTYCGPAKATLKVGGKTYRFKGGYCATDSSTWAIQVGTITLSGKPKHLYLAITVFSKKSGTHGAAVSWQTPGKSGNLLNAKVTLKRGLKKGTFTGRKAAGGRKATGSFTCK